LITPPQPSPEIRRLQKRNRFLFAQELDGPSLEALCRNSQKTLTVSREGGFVHGDMAEKGMDGAQAGIASASAVVAVVLKVLEECGHERGIQILHSKIAGLAVVMLGSELQQESEGIPVTGHRVATGTQLTMQASGEEVLEVLREIGDAHRRPPCTATNWCNSVAI
jgi:hypothetical protein